MSHTRTLPAELTIYTVGELRGQCLTWLGERPAEGDAGSEHWPLDASAVDQIDAAGVQLLVSLSHTLSQQGQPLVLQQPSAVLCDACSALGLGDWLATCTPEGAPA
ncbi:MAG: STAS domain-containing protein [Hydrogenophaga sp.]|uniref:STAS domain-containing protein n=1 Tax=Hydrogenophaga sp. TaxID=1904254 RepID=UPI003D9BA6DC